jgi:hypothetical protein
MSNEIKYIQRNKKGNAITIYGKDLNDLTVNVINWRQHNSEKGPIEYNQVYNQVRSQNLHQPEVKITKHKKTRSIKSFHETLNGAKALVKVSLGQHVSQTEFDRRAEICSSCPKLSLTSDCIGCGAAGRIANNVRKLSSEFGKTYNIPSNKYGPITRQYCGVCECSLALMLMAKIGQFSESTQKSSSNYKTT